MEPQVTSFAQFHLKEIRVIRFSFLLAALLSLSPKASAQIRAPQAPQQSSFQPVNLPASSSALAQTSPDLPVGQNKPVIQSQGTKKQDEFQALRAEIAAMSNKGVPPSRKIDTSIIKTHQKKYTDALGELEAMVAGKRKISVANACFVSENAFGNSYLTKLQFQSTLSESVGFIKNWLTQNGHSLHDNEALHLAIQRFMSETLSIRNPAGKVIIHQPFFYDYEDYQGAIDHRNFFTTKCLATGGGQCSSLPMVYLMLAEGLGAKAYLSFAPQHSFVKYADANGTIHNYEPTSNWKITDQWYADNMFISQQAIRSGIYLDTLNARQIVANCILDLAFNYIRKMGIELGHADPDFIKRCIVAVIPAFPKHNNIYSLFLYSSVLKAELDQEIVVNNIRDISQIVNFQKAHALWQEYQGNEQYIIRLGYQDTPPGLYQEMIKQQEFKGSQQQAARINGKQLRNPFTISN